MNNPGKSTRPAGGVARRQFLRGALAGATAFAAPGLVRPAAAADSLSMQTWSAAVDVVKSHLAAFETKTGIHVDYGNGPYAQYREAMVAKFAGGAPVDLLWVSDAWLPEWAEAGWIAPIDGYDSLMKYNADAIPFCTESMTYKGHQYGLTYYTDFMAFLYDADKLAAAGFSAPPSSWEEVVQQSIVMKQKGIAEFPMMLSMAQESWLIEFMTAMIYSHGGHFTDASNNAVMQHPKDGAVTTLQWVVDAVRKHKIVSPACVETGELAGLKALSAGNHAFALLPKYRLRTLNDPAQSKVAGKIKEALMPMGPGGSHETVGWMRFHGMTAQTAKNKARADNAARLIEWFGGKADGKYTFQKLVFLDAGSDFAVTPLYQDPEVQSAYSKYADFEMIKKQQALARKKDTIQPWFGEWNETNGSAWQAAILGNTTPAAALDQSAKSWNKLKSRA
ncbi:multiple sugar transport system substrate-binding protein [Nitrobacteraceae bacterium AZCC 2161]